METYKGMLEYCKKVCEINHWILNTDKETLDDLINGLIENKRKLGYQSYPCRLASGIRSIDRDIICTCDYAPPDINEYGSCYCNLFRQPNFYETGKSYVKIPERRPPGKEEAVLNYIKDR